MFNTNNLYICRKSYNKLIKGRVYIHTCTIFNIDFFTCLVENKIIEIGNKYSFKYLIPLKETKIGKILYG